MIIQINNDNYVVGFSTANTMVGIEYNQEVNEHFYENARYYYLENNTLVFDENKYNEDISAQEATAKLYTEKKEIEAWFVDYDKQVIQYTRAIALGQEYDKDILELHNEAEIKAIRLKEISE